MIVQELLINGWNMAQVRARNYFFWDFCLRLKSIQAVFIPVMTMIGQSRVQSMIQKVRLIKEGVCSDSFVFWGPSLNKCLFE